ncbi:2'-5' RNA ligase family protein [Kitasatospora sp. NPDC057692]|uniref:2'-5' RNA ligase family protein n=1 Tax=Kitasatospora sp. NPDC057692 TaxID=3346215 RepID=UPI0036CB18B7
MEKFVPKFQGAPWPDGARVLHVYAVPDLRTDRGLADLAGACRTAMRPYPITPLGDDTLHCTLDMIADTTSDRITPAERADLVAALREHLAATAPFEVTAGPPVANRAGAVLHLSPDHLLLDLRERVRDAIRRTRGPGALLHDGGRPHISLGYAWSEASSEDLRTALRRLSPGHAPVRVREVQLLDVRFRRHPRPGAETAWQLSWTPVATVPLAHG